MSKKHTYSKRQILNFVEQALYGAPVVSTLTEPSDWTSDHYANVENYDKYLYVEVPTGQGYYGDDSWEAFEIRVKRVDVL